MRRPERAHGILVSLLPLFLALAPTRALRSEGLTLEPEGLYGVSLDGYNRVDGLPVTIGVEGSDGGIDFYLRAIYRIASERLGGRAEITLRILRERDVVVGIEGHSITDTNDRWRVGDLENSLSAILFNEDFRNYHQRQGVSTSLEGNVHPLLRARVAWTADRYSSLGRRTDYALFGWDKSFRANSPVEEGWMGSLSLELETDTRNDPEDPAIGWFQRLQIEAADPALGGDFDFRTAALEVRRYDRYGSRTRIAARFTGMWGTEGTPAQRGIHVHGVGGLRGRRDDFTPRSRAFLTTVEARIDVVDGLPHVPLFRDRLGAVLFIDAGGFRQPGADGGHVLDVDAGAGIEGAGLLSYAGIFLAAPLGGGGGARWTVRVRRGF